MNNEHNENKKKYEHNENNKSNKHGNSLALFLVGSLIMTSLWGCAAKKESDSQQLESTEVVEAVSENDDSIDGDSDNKDTTDENEASYTGSDVSEINGTATANSYKNNHLTFDDINIAENYEDDGDGSHAITADGSDADYSDIAVYKTGEADGDEADFYGENAAIFATNGATLTLSGIYVESDGTHANGVFSYGEGTTVNISDSVIETSGNCSGGLMTTGGGTMNASNLTINTSGNSSAAIRSDRGGGTVNVEGGYYKTSGTGSPVIYSTADITVSDSYLESTASQGVVVEGKNSVTLNDCELVADNNTKNSDKSDTYQAVMIYQSMSGDAANGTSSFNMTGGSLTNANGDIFFVNNTACTINLEDVIITNNDSDGVFLRAAAAGWGNSGSNGGKVALTATNQNINGDMIVDDVSTLNLYLTNETAFVGAINSDATAGEVYVELDETSTWTLTDDSYITSLTCVAGNINLNGHILYVNGEVYTEGSDSTGEAIEIVSENSSGESDMFDGEAPDGMPGDASGSSDGSGKPDGTSGEHGGTPPEKPSGDNGGTPPEKPDK
ncbi:MAG: hypothetical protein IJ167_10095 [Lachnospiraceae bacterium]|nr:hypothetical protein [Lachnospiraceae bacterium]